MNNAQFQEFIWQKSRELYRDMPWREDTRPYYVLVSELMLQQTQVARVIPKFAAFIAAFPDEKVLAVASLADVLVLWQGLGYNRRAKFLHETAKKIMQDYEGIFPDNEIDLLTLSGVGKNTAGALLAYAFNHPSIFIETNIRTVYIHHFFADRDDVNDTEIHEKLAETLDYEHPREWYWALMDYGAWLKSQRAGSIQRSKHYKKQSPLAGSVREMRGKIIAQLADHSQENQELVKRFEGDERYPLALEGLLSDGLVERHDTLLRLTR